MNLIFPLLYFLLANGTIVYISKKSFGKCIPLTMMITAFVMFFSQVLFGTFKIGFYFNILIAILFPIFLIINKKDIKAKYFSNGFYAFLTIYVFLFIFNYNRSFTNWDEWSHWGVMIKEMFRLDKFYTVTNSTLMAHKDYPPILQMFELFWCKLCGGYGENYLITSLHTFTFSLFIPYILDFCKEKKIIKTIIKSLVMLLSVYLIMLIFDVHGVINSIYTDYFMAILVAFLLFIVIIDKKVYSLFNLLLISIGCSFLLLTKQMGLPLYLMVLFIMIGNIIIIIKKDKKNIKINKKNILFITKFILLLIVIPLSFWMGWNKYTSTMKVEQQFKLTDIKLSELKGIIAGTSGENYQQEAALNYYNAIKTTNITTSVFPLTYTQSVALAFLLLIIIMILYQNKDNKERFLLAGVTLGLGSIGYAFVMLVMYVFSFGPWEGPRLASFDRYMDTYIILMLIFLYMIYAYYNINNKNKEKREYMFLLLPFLLFLIESPQKSSNIYPKIIKSPTNAYEIHAQNIIKQTTENAKVFIIAQTSEGDYQYFVKYYMNPRITNLKYYSLSKLKNNNYESEFYKDVNKYMLKYDYLYLANIDDVLKDNYKFLFKEKIKNNQLYKITKENNKVKLELIKEK